MVSVCLYPDATSPLMEAHESKASMVESRPARRRAPSAHEAVPPRAPQVSAPPLLKNGSFNSSDERRYPSPCHRRRAHLDHQRISFSSVDLLSGALKQVHPQDVHG